MQQIFDLMGANFRPADAKDALRAAAIGDLVTLVPDGDNEYDPFAIEVHLEDHHIGFLPRGNQDLFDKLTHGEEPIAEIVGFPYALKPTIRVIL